MENGLRTGDEIELVERAGFGATLGGVNGGGFAGDQIFVEGILKEDVVPAPAIEALGIGFVFGEEQRRGSLKGENKRAESGVFGANRSGGRCV